MRNPVVSAIASIPLLGMASMQMQSEAEGECFLGFLGFLATRRPEVEQCPPQ